MSSQSAAVLAAPPHRWMICTDCLTARSPWLPSEIKTRVLIRWFQPTSVVYVVVQLPTGKAQIRPQLVSAQDIGNGTGINARFSVIPTRPTWGAGNGDNQDPGHFEPGFAV